MKNNTERKVGVSIEIFSKNIVREVICVSLNCIWSRLVSQSEIQNGILGFEAKSSINKGKPKCYNDIQKSF